MMRGMMTAVRQVKSIVVGLISGILLALVLKQRGLALFLTTLLGGVFYFFRDPDRIPPVTSDEWILAPADGQITDIELIDEPDIFKGEARRISIFLSIFDVHVQRVPYQGVVILSKYQPGEFAPAFLKDTRQNEFNLIGLSTPHGSIGVKQISGILARRIVCWVKPGDSLETGERFGLIKFGSRVDLLLPPDVELLVSKGQRVQGGQTIMARWPL